MLRLFLGLACTFSCIALPAAGETFEVNTPSIKVSLQIKRFEVTTPLVSAALPSNRFDITTPAIVARLPNAARRFRVTTPSIVVRLPQPDFIITAPVVVSRPQSQRLEVTTPTITAMASAAAPRPEASFDQLFPGPTGMVDEDAVTDCPPVYAYMQNVKKRAQAGADINADMQAYLKATMAGMPALMQQDYEGWCEIVSQQLE